MVNIVNILGNILKKTISTTENQNLPDEKKEMARNNIGAASIEHTHSQYLTSHQDISGKADVANPVFLAVLVLVVLIILVQILLHKVAWEHQLLVI